MKHFLYVSLCIYNGQLEIASENNAFHICFTFVYGWVWWLWFGWVGG